MGSQSEFALGKALKALAAEREVSDKLEKALEEINKNDPFKQSSAGIIARATLSEVAAIRSKGEKQ